MSKLEEGPDANEFREALKHTPPTGPSCWGPMQWMALHQMLRGYPLEKASQDKQDGLRQYVLAMASVIPCERCSSHWRQLAPTVRTENRYEALKWSIDAHNTVNRRLQKPVYTYAQALDLLKGQCPNNQYQPCEPCKQDQTPAIALGCSLAVVAVLAIILLVLLVKARTPSRST